MVLLDRDGVINVNRDDYVKCVAEFIFLPGVKNALRKLAEAGYKIAVVSNQQCVGKGIISPEELSRIDQYMREEVEKAGGRIDGSYYCPHLKDENCGCRKPATGMLEKASRDLAISLSEATFIGDTARDIEAGHRAGCRTMLVLSGILSAKDVEDLLIRPDKIAPDLSVAVDMILESEQ